MFKKVLVPIKLTDPSSWTGALPVAISLAKASKARITLRTILPGWISGRDADWSWDADRRMEDIAQHRLENLARQYGCENYALQAVWGSTPWTILDMASEADLVVMAAHRRGLLSWLFCPAALKVARKLPCSVMLVRDTRASR